MYDYDVIFIGSGHSCNHGAGTLAAAGKKVALVEQDKMGGTCTNYGCDAKIILEGHGVLKDAHTVEVNGKNYTAEYIVIGAGQRDSKHELSSMNIFAHRLKIFLRVVTSSIKRFRN